MPNFTSFVIFGEMRTGSNFLEKNLNRLQGLRCYGEAFNPHILGNQTNTTLCGFTAAERDKNPLGLLAAMRAQTDGISGFRYFNDHDPRVLDTVLNDPTCAKIILTRHPVESYVSWKIAVETNQWLLTNTHNYTAAQIKFDPIQFERYLQKIKDFQMMLLHRLQTSGQTAFYLNYEDITDLDVLNGLAAFLGVTHRLNHIDSTLKKQNPGPLENKVSNPEEMVAALARIDRFDVSRIPNFEPRRNAGVPNYLGLNDFGLLFMPVAGAPYGPISAWMGGLGPVTKEFDRKSLRLWKQAHPQFRSFTVLRHPLARAYTVFCAFLSDDPHPELRSYLARFHNLTVPPKGMPFQSETDFRSDFSTFLTFLKRNLSAQTGVKVLAQFASQLAILQGFAALGVPDVILRETDLARGLSRIAEDLGLPPPQLPPEPAPNYPALAQIYGPDLESAARAAYGKDYVGFGFGNWSAD